MLRVCQGKKRNRKSPVQRVFQIGISGSYGGMNLGDEAILDGIVSQLRKSLPVQITVFSRNPADTLSRHDVERSIPVRELTRKEVTPEIQRLDLFIIGGGGIFFDGEAERFLREVFIAQEIGVPVAVYAVSAGPLISRSAREALRRAMNAADILTVRDRQAYRLLEDIGVTKEIELTADPALLLKHVDVSLDRVKAEGVEFERHLVGLSVRERGPAAPDIDPEDYYTLLANAADYIADRLDADLVFVPMERTDIQHSHAVVAHMHNASRSEVLRREYSPQEILGLLGHFEFAVGMRLHFLIFAALRGVPFTALPYASKVTGFLQDLNEEVPPLGNFGIGQLIARIDCSWDTRKEISDRIAAGLPNLQERARKTNQLIVEFLKMRAGGSTPKAA
jgi:polysaccharide pyruvyl transferase CsaB